ncbi:hypothetical protein CB1_000875033 [Camelus ferus]|nr:hypothetical protein CB1_000875033 [Camelus ferus]
MDLVQFVSKVRNLKVVMATGSNLKIQNVEVPADPQNNITIYEIWGEEDSEAEGGEKGVDRRLRAVYVALAVGPALLELLPLAWTSVIVATSRDFVIPETPFLLPSLTPSSFCRSSAHHSADPQEHPSV